MKVLNEQVSDYINKAPEEQKLIMQELRNLLHETAPLTVEGFKWGRPVFTLKTDFAYLKSSKAYVTLGFFDSHRLPDEKNLLEGTGKDMRHIKIRNVEGIDRKMLKRWFTIFAQ